MIAEVAWGSYGVAWGDWLGNDLENKGGCGSMALDGLAEVVEELWMSVWAWARGTMICGRNG